MIRRGCIERVPTYTPISTIKMANVLDSFNVRQKYSHFRILVIGRANAGKTTLLKWVCNTTEDPRIYNEGMNLVRFPSGSRRGIALTSKQLEPTSAVIRSFNSLKLTFWLVADQRSIHDILCPFAFESNPQFIFHDSPGFEAGDDRQLKEVQAFIEKRAKSNEPNDQLHAIWSVVNLFFVSSYVYMLLQVLFWTKFVTASTGTGGEVL